MKKTIKFLAIAILGGVFTLVGYKFLVEKPQIIVKEPSTNNSTLQTVKSSFNVANTKALNTPSSFIDAAEKTVNAVVHVKNTAIKTQVNPWAEMIYGQGSGTRKYAQVGTGSGVIISEDGFIITNNHVIAGATEIEITLNNRKKYKADLIGTDSKSDIALLKIDATEKLPYIPYGDSDNVQIGEWVLAVGNPYNLTSTVTAGIVSAKGRDLEGNGVIDSFIQTDAAVNPGNSGGALVNTRGELVGINTAISSRTGSFIGYSFAVPSNTAKKVIEDIMEFGVVQEAILGVTPGEKEDVEGVIIIDVDLKSGAAKAGLKAGDIIIKVDKSKITKFSELKGQLTERRPGDIIKVTVLRDGNKITKKVKLTKRTMIHIPNFGIVLKDVTKKDKRNLDIDGGAKIEQINNKNLEYYGVRKGFVITKINRVRVNSALGAKKLIDQYYGKGPIYFEMINNQGEVERYGFR